MSQMLSPKSVSTQQIEIGKNFTKEQLTHQWTHILKSLGSKAYNALQGQIPQLSMEVAKGFNSLWGNNISKLLDDKSALDLKLELQNEGIDLSEEINITKLGKVCSKAKNGTSKIRSFFGYKDNGSNNLSSQELKDKILNYQKKLKGIQEKYDKNIEKFNQELNDKVNKALLYSNITGLFSVGASFYSIKQVYERSKAFNDRKGVIEIMLDEIKKELTEMITNLAENKIANWCYIEITMKKLDLIKEECEKKIQISKDDRTSSLTKSISSGLQTYSTYQNWQMGSQLGADPRFLALTAAIGFLQVYATGGHLINAHNAWNIIRQWNKILNNVIDTRNKLEQVKKELELELNISKESKYSELTKTINEVELWLKEINKFEYWNLFEENGYEEMEIVLDMTEQDLIEIGVNKTGHRKLLLKHISKKKINKF